jgi:GTP cyclohydrolase IA
MKPTKEEALEAVRTLIKYIDDNPDREGLAETPQRVIKSFEEIFSGYTIDPCSVLDSVFFEKSNFHDFVFLKTIKFKSMCEHHMLPIIGTADIAYIPNNSIVGISKLARVVEVLSRRLQIQERMTADIAETIQKKLNPLGVAVKISSLHHCMSMRGVNQDGSLMETMHFTGVFLTNQKHRQEFFSLLKS